MKNARAGHAELLFWCIRVIALWRFRSRRRVSSLFGSLSNHDAYGDENVTSKSLLHLVYIIHYYISQIVRAL